MPRHKPWLCVFIGDTHVGAVSGLSLRPQGEGQTWLLKAWRSTIQTVLKQAVGHRLSLHYGGDLVDAPGKQYRDEAAQLLRAWANRADEAYAVTGTEYHVGEDGEEDRTIYDVLGVPAKHQRRTHRITIDGRHLWWSHHAISVGHLPWTEYDGVYRAAKTCYYWAQQMRLPIPHLVVGHHAHVAPSAVARYRDTQAAVVPCWQLQTPYGARRGAFRLPVIGIMWWRPISDEVGYIVHPIPDEIRSA